MEHPATSFATGFYLLARRHLDNIAAGGEGTRESVAAQLLADGDIALRGLHDEQRGANIHRRQRLQFLINNLATLLARVQPSSPVLACKPNESSGSRWSPLLPHGSKLGPSLTWVLRTSTPSLKRRNLFFSRQRSAFYNDTRPPKSTPGSSANSLFCTAMRQIQSA